MAEADGKIFVTLRRGDNDIKRFGGAVIISQLDRPAAGWGIPGEIDHPVTTGGCQVGRRRKSGAWRHLQVGGHRRAGGSDITHCHIGIQEGVIAAVGNGVFVEDRPGGTPGPGVAVIAAIDVLFQIPHAVRLFERHQIVAEAGMAGIPFIIILGSDIFINVINT